MRYPSHPLSAGFEKIVVGTDFSKFAALALLRAADLAQRFHSSIVLVHVIDPVPAAMEGVPFLVRLMESDAREQLEVSAGILKQAGVPYQLAVRCGDVRDALYRAVEENHANLLVIGTHGPHRFDRPVCGSVAERILRSAPCPVMTVGPEAMPSTLAATSTPRLLYPTHLKSISLRIAPFVDAMAHHLGAELHLLCVCPSMSQQKQHNREVLDELERTAEREIRLTSKVRCIVETGRPSETIAAAASALKANFTLLGIHREDLARRPAGGLHVGLAYQIVAHTACPVITLNDGLAIRSLRAAQSAEETEEACLQAGA